jgi:hypothetical protein
VKCYVCSEQATVEVVASRLTMPDTRYTACDEHEPRHIPQGDVVSVTTTPLPITR